mmetsp:Transcript_17974/g.62174  ORF Transcript_17974/g.62174 Transcript_17974/m.62174 type:complete len:220 (-) Transcript_17974:102-761(-)
MDKETAGTGRREEMREEILQDGSRDRWIPGRVVDGAHDAKGLEPTEAKVQGGAAVAFELPAAGQKDDGEQRLRDARLELLGRLPQRRARERRPQEAQVLQRRQHIALREMIRERAHALCPAEGERRLPAGPRGAARRRDRGRGFDDGGVAQVRLELERERPDVDVALAHGEPVRQDEAQHRRGRGGRAVEFECRRALAGHARALGPRRSPAAAEGLDGR